MDDSLAKDLVEKLKSCDTIEAKEVLSEMYRMCRDSKEQIKDLQKHSVVGSLIFYLQHSEHCNVSLKIIAECCKEKCFIIEFIEVGGIECLEEIIKCSLNDQNFAAACFVLEIITKHGGCSHVALDNITTIPDMLKFLSRTDESELQYTVCHALMVLQTNCYVRKSILKAKGIKCILNLVNTSNIKLLMCVIKTIFSVEDKISSYLRYEQSSGSFQNLNESVVITGGYLVLPDTEIKVIQLLLELSSHEEEIVQNYALISLIDICLSFSTLVKFDSFNFNATKQFIKILFVNKPLELKHLALIALRSYLTSRCYRDESTVLFCVKNLLNLLKSKIYHNIHSHVLSILIYLYQNDRNSMTNLLLDLNLAKVLVSVLTEITHTYKCNHLQSFKHIQSAGIYGCTETSGQRCLLEITSSRFRNTCSWTGWKIFDMENGMLPECDYEVIGDDESKSTKTFGSLLSELFEPYYSSADDDVFIFSKCMDEYGTVINEIRQNPFDLDRYILQMLSLLKSQTLSVLTPETFSLLEYGYYFPNNFHYIEILLNKLSSDHSTIVELILNKFVLCLELFEGSLTDIYDSINNLSLWNIKLEYGSESIVIQILQSKEEESKLMALHALSKFVTSKAFLKKVLTELNGLKMLVTFLSNDSLRIRMISVISVCEIYNSLSSLNSSLIDSYCPIPPSYSTIQPLYSHAFSIASSSYPPALLRCSPPSSSYSPAPPLYSSGSSSYSSAPPLYSSGTPSYSHASPSYSPALASYSPASPSYSPALLSYSPALPSYSPASPSYSPASPSFSLASPDYWAKTESLTCCYSTSDFNVQFSLDGGETVEANRELICEHSEYFRALLMGDFIESTESTVHLPDISADNLNAIFHFLHGCRSNNCNLMENLTFSQKLSLFADSERFLLTEFKMIIEVDLTRSLDYYDNVSQIYEVSKIHNCPTLADKALKKALRISREDVEWWGCFDELLKSDLRLNVLSDIEELLTRLLE